MMIKKSKKSKNPNGRQSTFEVVEETVLLDFLLKTIKDKSRTKIKALLAHKQIKVGNEVTTKFDYKLLPSFKVTVSWDMPFKKVVYQGLKIVFEDEHIIVINKRSGLLSVGTAKEKKTTAYRIVQDHIQQTDPTAHLFVVHRLDRESSGLMVFAKNRKAQQEMQDTWNQTVAKRKYLIATQGTFEKDEDSIVSYLKESKALIVYSSNNPKEGKRAESNYSVVKKNEYYTLLEAWQKTELKHQLRAQLGAKKHPILGDKKYGATENPLGRVAFHARVLTFIHPASHKEVSFETNVPDDFLMIFRQKYYE
ncbi:MAG: RluA family pseudouridine synthase [Flavobacteriales bacterium]|nr:RluA family pseudouridine synthase [Flavobacteriales bacterium]